MAQQNFQTQLDSLISSLNGVRPTLLLHACCGPCSSYVIEYLSGFFDITILYYNPNIFPREEYERRFLELKNLLPRFDVALKNNVKLVEQNYNDQDFYKAIDIQNQPELAHEPEKGERCRRCYEFRLHRTWQYAAANGFDYFCTTLSISPFKDAQKINEIGVELAKNSDGLRTEAAFGQASGTARIEATVCEPSSVYRTEAAFSQAPLSLTPTSPRWLPSDFKKKGGFKRSLELSTEYGLYRQQYCGCIYSMQNAILK